MIEFIIGALVGGAITLALITFAVEVKHYMDGAIAQAVNRKLKEGA